MYDHLNSVKKNIHVINVVCIGKIERSKQKYNDFLLEVGSWVIFVFFFVSFCTFQNVLKRIYNKILFYVFFKVIIMSSVLLNAYYLPGAI